MLERFLSVRMCLGEKGHCSTETASYIPIPARLKDDRGSSIVDLVSLLLDLCYYCIQYLQSLIIVFDAPKPIYLNLAVADKTGMIIITERDAGHAGQDPGR